MKFHLIIQLCILGSSHRHVSAQDGYEFSADAETLLIQPLVREFSCEGRDYGYYADIANNCQVFHICWPKFNELEEQVGMNQWSFICGNQTVFDQSTLTCNHFGNAFPCEESESLYADVDWFKVPEEK